ncbi:MAG: iron complex outermembrane receptor protein [Rhodothermales bacterium]|jgi:iron complex outermembrane receptor protein
MKSRFEYLLGTLSICCVVMFLPSVVQAQDANDESVGSLEEIIVTGSRIKRKDLTSVGPVTVITAEDIANTGITNLEVLLQRLPSAAGFGGNQTSAYWVSNGWGTPQINLRGLGINRTLVLLNGRRVVFGGTGANSSVDLSMIPMSLIERIEVLKDGASATYGADAVAGVVNLITKSSFQGLELSSKIGQTDESDGEEFLADLTWGVAGGDGSVMVNLSFQDNSASPLSDSSRAPCPLFPDGAGGLVCGGSSSTVGGRTTLPAGTVMPDGSVLTDPTRINFNQDPNGNGDFFEPYSGSKHSFNYNPYFNAVQPIKRASFSTFGTYNLNAESNLFTEIMFTHRTSEQPASPATLTNIPFAADHPTNPTGVAFNLERRRLLENGSRTFLQEVNTWRVVTGVQGLFNDDWSYEAAINWGRNTATDSIANNINTGRLAQTLDPAICGSGGIPCADIIGYPDVTQDVLDYIVFNQTGNGGNEQKSFTANISGSIFDMPAGPVGFATGVEWREESGWRNPDSLVVAGIALGNQADPIAGTTTSSEIYAEVHVPILEGASMAQSLDMDLALRYSDYDLFDSDTNYKVGINWQVNDTVKVRGTFTTAFRIPNVPELFGGVSEGNLTTSDPCNNWSSLSPSSAVYQNCQAAGVPMNYTQLGNTILTDRGGNPNLQPEDAESFTFGLVLQPTNNLSLTIDYFDIDITDAIRETPGTTKLSICYDSPGLSHAFCGPTHHTRDPVNGDVNYLSTQKTNTGKEVMQGMDFGVVFGFDAWGMSNVLDFNATYLMEYESTAFDGDAPSVINGFIGGGNGGYPEWRANTSLTSNGEKWSGTYSVQMIGSAKDFFSTTGIGSSMPNVFYQNVQVSYAFNDKAKMSFGIDNIFQEDPPYVASWTDGNTDTMTYDLAGRRAHLRLTYHWD